jgi:hypothetical protein
MDLLGLSLPSVFRIRSRTWINFLEASYVTNANTGIYFFCFRCYCFSLQIFHLFCLSLYTNTAHSKRT